MTELYPSDADLNAMSGQSDPQQDVPYITIGESPYHTSFYRMLYRLLDVARRAGDLRVYKDGDLTFGVRPGRFMNGDAPVDYAGAEEVTLSNNATNYIYLSADGTLEVSVTDFPDPAATPHLPLATIVTAQGAYTHDDITDYRGRSILAAVSALSPAGANEAAAFFGATDISGGEAETLTDGSVADSLHVHDTAGLADGAVEAGKLASGTVSNAHVAADAGIERSKLAEEQLASCPIPAMSRCRREDGSLMSASGPGSGSFGIIDNGWGTGGYHFQGFPVQNSSETSTLKFEVPLPTEYVAGADLQLVVRGRYDTSGGSSVSATIDANVFKLDADGVATEIRSSSTKTLTSAFTDHVFDDISTAALAAGDRVEVFLRTVVTEGGDTGTAWSELGRIELRMDVKG